MEKHEAEICNQMPMKILVCNLCLSRNLGGPAMALTFVNEVKRMYPHAEFKFAVAKDRFDQESKWAAYYGLSIVARDTFKKYIKLFNPGPIFYHYIYSIIKRKRSNILAERNYNLRVNKSYQEAFLWADIVINMSGISYVGDGFQPWKNAWLDLYPAYMAKKHKKPYAAFIQSYGPFQDWRVRLLAKREMKLLPFIAARGKSSASYCRAIVKDKKKVFDFPDCAILMGKASESWANNCLSKLSLCGKKIVILAPSSVIRNSTKRYETGSVGDKHIEAFVQISLSLISDGFTLLFLPHMYSECKEECDREICRDIIRNLKTLMVPSNAFCLVEDDLDPFQAKSLIGKAYFAVVSRYHALVAAVSTATPAVALGWNVKYKDLLNYYDLANAAIDVRKHQPAEIAQMVIRHVREDREKWINNLLLHRETNETKVGIAFQILFDWIDGVTIHEKY